MLDLLLEGGTVIDGSGVPPYGADVGVKQGRIVEVGRVTSPARERVDARGADKFDAEFDLIEALARAAARPLSMTWLQRDPGGDQWRAMRARVEAAVERGLPLYLQAAPRGIGVINGLDASFHPFMGFPG